jgi:hypothetical protein
MIFPSFLRGVHSVKFRAISILHLRRKGTRPCIDLMALPLLDIVSPGKNKHRCTFELTSMIVRNLPCSEGISVSHWAHIDDRDRRFCGFGCRDIRKGQYTMHIDCTHNRNYPHSVSFVISNPPSSLGPATKSAPSRVAR